MRENEYINKILMSNQPEMMTPTYSQLSKNSHNTVYSTDHSRKQFKDLG